MPRHAARTDNNHAEIALALKWMLECGLIYNYWDVHEYGGMADFLVATLHRVPLFLEVKSSTTAKLTAAETILANCLPLNFRRVETREETIAAVREVDERED